VAPRLQIGMLQHACLSEMEMRSSDALSVQLDSKRPIRNQVVVGLETDNDSRSIFGIRRVRNHALL
jgi:hypothetical protein